MIKVRVLPKQKLYLDNRWYFAGQELKVDKVTDELKPKVKKIKKKGEEDGGI
jgi:hypothetical protein